MDQRVSSSPTNIAPDIAAALSLDKSGRATASKRKWLRYLLIPLVLFGGFYGYQSWSTKAATTKTYVSEPATIGNLVVEVSASGTLQPLTKVDVSSEQSGVVRQVNFDENDSVKKGDILAVLDTTTLSAQVERAEASVVAAKARITDAQTTLKEMEQTLDRSKSLATRGTLSQQDLEGVVAKRDRATSSVTSVEADLAVAQADLKLQQAALAKSTIYAPIDGIILTRSVDTGQTVAASLSAPILFVIAADLKNMKLEAAIDEADIGMVAKDQNAKFKVDAYPDKNFDAAITQIAYASQTTDNVVTYEAQLGVDNTDLTLRPGMTANVNIIVREANGVLTVPNSAFRYQPTPVAEAKSFSLTSMFMPRMGRQQAKSAPAVASDGTRTLYLLKNGAPEAVQVKTGSTDGTRTEVLSGVAENDVIVTAESTKDTAKAN
jgi:HlyD family secretion protein